LLGIKISKEDIIDILYRLDLRGKKDIEGDEFNIEVPEDRLDLNI
jgi:phenylalanyl-tRNA synthetase beta subunit